MYIKEKKNQSNFLHNETSLFKVPMEATYSSDIKKTAAKKKTAVS
jgi:hypothetical protein